MTIHTPAQPTTRKSGTWPHPTVPYIATWSAEQVLKPTVVLDRRRGRISYGDEGIADRDSHGVLWNRITLKPGHGTPQLGKVHSLRQRRAMRRLLCQVCAGPADLNEHGMLWLLGDYAQDWPHWPEGMGTPHPPVCLPCAWKSTRACPHLTGGFAAVRVQHYPVVGVYGGIHDPRDPDRGPVIDEVVGHHHPDIRLTIHRPPTRPPTPRLPTGRPRNRDGPRPQHPDLNPHPHRVLGCLPTGGPVRGAGGAPATPSKWASAVLAGRTTWNLVGQRQARKAPPGWSWGSRRRTVPGEHHNRRAKSGGRAG